MPFEATATVTVTRCQITGLISIDERHNERLKAYSFLEQAFFIVSLERKGNSK